MQADCLCVIRSTVYHGEEDPINAKLWIDLLADFCNGPEKQVQSLGRQVVRLRWDDDTICRSQCVDGHKTKRGHTVNKDVVIFRLYLPQHIPHNSFAAHSIEQI